MVLNACMWNFHGRHLRWDSMSGHPYLANPREHVWNEDGQKVTNQLVPHFPTFICHSNDVVQGQGAFAPIKSSCWAPLTRVGLEIKSERLNHAQANLIYLPCVHSTSSSPVSSLELSLNLLSPSQRLSAWVRTKVSSRTSSSRPVLRSKVKMTWKYLRMFVLTTLPYMYSNKLTLNRYWCR